jgi:hypothetical protein
MKNIFMLLAMILLPLMSYADITRNAVVCTLNGSDSIVGINFTGETGSTGTFKAVASYRLMNGSEILESGTNALIQYSLVLNKAGNFIQLKNLAANLGKSGTIQISVPKNYEKSKVKVKTLSLMNKSTAADCMMYIDTNTKPGISGSN